MTPKSEFEGYCFISDWDGDGRVYDESNNVRWEFKTTGLNREAVTHRPVFMLKKPTEQGCHYVARERRFPKARFQVFGTGPEVCKIRQCSLLFTRYEVEFSGGLRWVLHFPLFTAHGWGETECGAKMFLRTRRRTEWWVKISAGYDTATLVTALAFVSRKRLQCT